MDMDLKTLRNEIRNLSELVDGWNAPDEVPGIERDLALEKLRKLYDSLRFELPAFSRNTTEAPVPESIDLDVAFSIEPLAVVEPEFVAADVNLPEPKVDPVLVPETQPVSAGTPEAVPDPETVTRLAPRSEPAIASQPVAATLPEPIPEADPVFVPMAQPASAGTPEAEPGSALDAESDPVKPTAPRNSASQPVVPTLFGPEEAVFRHRHKQRIIMSLYGAEPQEPVSESNHTVQPSPDQPFSEGDASAEKSNAVQSAVETPVASERIESATPASGAEKAVVTSSENPIAEEPVTAISQAAITDCDESHLAAEPYTSESASDAAPTAEPFTSENAPTEDRPVAETAPTATEPLAAVLSVTTEPPAVDLSAAPTEEQPAFEELPVAPGAVLGEVINHDVRTLADTIAPVQDMAATLRRGEPVEDLRSAIGINDKFLLIRDLFGGDGAACEAAIDALNRFDNLDDCMIHIAENYAWNPHSDGAKFLMELLERKYS